MGKLLKSFGLISVLILSGISASVLPLAKTPENVKITFSAPGEMDGLLKYNPNMKKLTPKVYKQEVEGTADSEVISPHYLHIYILGERTFDDRIVDTASDSYNWNDLMDVRMNVFYPEVGQNGSEVTFLNIWVSQSSSLGNAYVTSGGIGFRHIHFYIEANYTTHFDFYFNIYGRD